MKTAYLIIAILGLLLVGVGSIITIAPGSDVVVARQLARNPESWNLELKQSSERLGDATHQKELLVRYIERAGNPTDLKDRIIEISVLIVSLLCVVGWFRERHHERKNEKGA